MFCGECGTKNKENAKFCEKCGKDLEEKKSTKTETPKAEKEVAKKVTPKEKKPMKKGVLFTIIGCSVLVVALVVLYFIGSFASSPEKVVENYVDSIAKKDYAKLYKYQVDVNDGDTTFTSKDAFVTIMKNSGIDTITNYKLGKVVYSDGKIAAYVPITYTTEKESKEKEDKIYLKKSNKKNFLIFDKWVLSESYNDSSVIKNFEVKVPKDAKVEYAGIKVDKKYLDTNKSSSSQDVYVLKQVLPIRTTVKTTLTNNIVIEEKVTPSSYTNSYTAKLTSSTISDSLKKELVNLSKNNIDAIFKGAMAQSEYDKLDIKNKGEKLKETYENYVQKINNLSGEKKLTKLGIKTADYSSLSVTSDNLVKIYVKITYDYTIVYKEQTKDKTGTDYVYLTYDLSGKDYTLEDASSLPDYFYYY